MKNRNPFEKEQDIHDKLLLFMKDKADGKTTTEIEKATKISRKTVEKHLQLLVKEHELYYRQYGPTRVYYPFTYEEIKSDKVMGKDEIIWLDLIERNDKKELLIKKKKKVDGKWLTKNSLSIDEDKLKEFAAKVGKIVK